MEKFQYATLYAVGFFLLCWILAVTSPAAADSLVELGIFSPSSITLGIPLIGGHGVVIGLLNATIIAGVGFICHSIAIVVRESVFMWDDDPTKQSMLDDDYEDED